jgi:peptidoglycan hydrolase-like protein with peptidoglycan-binding domain
MATPAHRRMTESGASGAGPRLLPLRVGLIIGAVVVVGAVASGAAIAIDHRGGSGSGTASGTQAAAGGKSSPTTAPVVPLTVRSVTPASSATNVATNSTIAVTFSEPLAPGAPVPTLAPPIAGHWTQDGASFVFQPRGGYIPFTRETVSVPSSVSAHEGTHTVTLGSTYLSSFQVQNGSFLRLQELLAELKYLPFTFTPSPSVTTDSATSASAPTSALSSMPTEADAIRTEAVPGALAWAYPNVPASLSSQWTQGTDNVLTRGAVMAFEADHGLAVDGVAGPEVWTDLLNAVASRDVDPRPYSYIEVTENLPETLTVWQGGSNVFSSPANTGVTGANTELGTFPIYTHEAATRMKGTDVNGTKYNVPVQWVGYFYGGDAVHGYPRASYGFPQSNGCVELPEAQAEQIFNDDINYYGTLVTVSPA